MFGGRGEREQKRVACRGATERMPMKISCASPTTLDSPEHVALAEELGYERAWLYDTPQQSPDVWMMLALAAQRTERIGLGPGVLVPSLRHPMVNAAATAALVALAPDRVAVAFGTGFSGRRAMGYRAIPWAYMDAYIRAYRGLLRGETVEWEGARMRMLHPPGHGAPRPVEVPVLISALGPKGAAVARELADGLFATLTLPEFAKEFSAVSYLFWGTVLDDGEDPRSERVQAAGGPGLALAYHGAYEFNSPLSELPGGTEWQAVVERTAPERAPPRRPRATLRRSQRGRPRRLGRGRARAARAGDDQRDRRPGRCPALRARGGGRDRIGVPTLRSGHPARACGVHGRPRGQPSRREGEVMSMTSKRTLTPLVEGGSYFECPRWREGRWWVSDFYRHAVYSYDSEGGSGSSSRSKPSPRGSAGCRTATCLWCR